MNNIFKERLFWRLLIMIVWLCSYTSYSFANPPVFEQNFAKPLMDTSTQYGNESLRDRGQLGLDKDKSITDNIKAMFYPDISGQGWKIRDLIKVLWLIIFVGALVIQWFMYILQSDNEDTIKWYHTNIAYILLGGLLFFAATWILGIGLSVWWDWWTTGLLDRLDKGILFQIFSWIRAWAFFTAIILLWYYWRSMISAMDDEEKVKKMRQWIINIIIVLISIKIIDYIYFIAQAPNFKSKATELIVEVSKVMWYMLWGFFTLSLIYYWFRLMFSWWDEEALKKVKNVIISILLWTIVIFLFFLIIYQIVQEFSW